MREHMPDTTLAIMVEKGAYPDHVMRTLEAGGYVIHEVPAIRTKPTEFAASRWPRTFTKLNLWSLPYDKVVYFDADACPYKPFGELFNIDHRIAATHTAKWQLKRFRSGMLVIEPDGDVYDELVHYATEEDPEKNAAKLGDQGVLNNWFGKDFITLPYKYNYCEWQRKPKEPVVIGHLRPTPWSGKRPKPAMAGYLKKWKQYLSQF